jgi:hypothetical protein
VTAAPATTLDQLLDFTRQLARELNTVPAIAAANARALIVLGRPAEADQAEAPYLANTGPDKAGPFACPAAEPDAWQVIDAWQPPTLTGWAARAATPGSYFEPLYHYYLPPSGAVDNAGRAFGMSACKESRSTWASIAYDPRAGGRLCARCARVLGRAQLHKARKGGSASQVKQVAPATGEGHPTKQSGG